MMTKEERQELINKICEKYHITSATEEEFQAAKKANDEMLIEQAKKINELFTKLNDQK